MSHTSAIKVRFYELDPYNHVNHSIYVQYCEVARVEWLTEIGFPLERLQADGFQLVVTEVRIRYLGSAGPGETLTVHSDLVELRRASMRFRQLVKRGEELLVEQIITVATTSRDGRPMRIPPELAAALSDAG